MSTGVQQEWQTGNQEIQFPFSDSCLGASQQVPTDFLLDLRLFLTGTDEVEVWLKTIQYHSVDDSYFLQFCSVSTGETVLQGGLPRLTVTGSSKAGKKQYLAEGSRVALFTPGPKWETPSWGGNGDWNKVYLRNESLVEPSLVNPGPKTFRRIFIEGEPIPDEALWPYGGTQILVGGYNLEFGSNTSRIPFIVGGNTSLQEVVELTCRGGAGTGYPPAPSNQIDYLTTIHQAAPDERGNLNINLQDCLRIFQPTSGGALLPHRLTFSSDCAPCCPCDQYQNVSRAIGRRSAKLKDGCDEVNRLLKNSEQAYNDAVQQINAKRPALVTVRNVRASGSHISFTVQNQTNLPLFAYVAFNVVSSPRSFGPATSTSQNAVVVDQGSVSNVHDVIFGDRINLPALTYQDSENPLSDIPVTTFSTDPADALLRIGSYTVESPFSPIPPGTLVPVRLQFPEVQSELDDLQGDEVLNASIAGSLPVLSFRSIGVYGASKCYGCAAETYTVSIKPPAEDNDPLSRCDILTPSYEGVPLSL